MKRKINIAAILMLFLITAVSCKKGIRGNGDTIIETRNITGSVTAIQTNSDIKLFVSYGNIQKVEVKGYSNLVAITQTTLDNNKLIIKYKDEYVNVRNSNVEVYVTIPVLDGVYTNGSGNVEVNGFLLGAGLNAGINGSSNIRIMNSIYNNVHYDINGSGDIKASGLAAKNADITINGSGDVELSCSQNLKVRIYGSGDVRFWGNPSLDVQVSGSGTVRQQ